MAFETPKNRLNIRQIRNEKQKIPIDQIIAIEGHSPIATGISTAGNVIGQALLRRAALRQEGEALARQQQQVNQLANFLGERPIAEPVGLSPELYLSAVKQKRLSNMPPSDKGLQFAGLDEFGNPVVFNPNTGALQTGNRQTNSQGALLPKQKKVLPSSVLQDVKNQESAISLLENAAATSPEIMKRSVGMYGGSIAPALSKIPGVGVPFRDPERAVFQQNVKTGFLKFLYSEAGKQLSDPERIAVQDAIGSVETPMEEFVPKLNGALSIIKSAQSRYMESLGESGYIAPGLQRIEPQKPVPITPKKVGRFEIEVEP